MALPCCGGTLINAPLRLARQDLLQLVPEEFMQPRDPVLLIAELRVEQEVTGGFSLQGSLVGGHRRSFRSVVSLTESNDRGATGVKGASKKPFRSRDQLRPLACHKRNTIAVHPQLKCGCPEVLQQLTRRLNH
jgi:hypothetical protein